MFGRRPIAAQHLVDDELRPVGENRRDRVAAALEPLDRAAEPQVDAAPGIGFAEARADVLVEAAQELVAAVQQRHAAAEAAEDAGELDRDVAAADDQDALRQAFEMEHLVRGDAELAARDRRLERRVGAGRDQDGAGPNARPGLGDPHRMRVLDHGAAVEDLDPAAHEVRAVDVLEPRDLGVLVADQRRPVEARLGHAPAETGRVLELVLVAARIDEQLLRHAAADHAGAAHAVLFGEHHGRAVAGGDAGGADAPRAAADHEEIDIEIAHGTPTFRSCGPMRKKTIAAPIAAAHHPCQSPWPTSDTDTAAARSARLGRENLVGQGREEAQHQSEHGEREAGADGAELGPDLKRAVVRMPDDEQRREGRVDAPRPGASRE